ncbi:hypothetical protein STCA_1886 [Klebsiella pneumoniae]|nr:hypothetical protein STCA_1886 [Klebsiella pneumoniae]SJN01412.1 hypothetical protein STCB_1527 [Klebsiella pneumoniae]SKC29597.1 hypothetical protein STCC_4369 [Klebsiella pneumoniae]
MLKRNTPQHCGKARQKLIDRHFQTENLHRPSVYVKCGFA